jgi:uncharacterized protein (TIGR03083 family)
MADLAEIYDVTRKEIADFVVGLPERELERQVPATPGWSIRDIIAHLAGDAACTIEGDFPLEFFAAPGSEEGVVLVNDWTGRQVSSRRDRSLQELLDEWEKASALLVQMIDGIEPWPTESMWFAGHVLATDITIHQQDIYGALGVERNRDTDGIAHGFSTYVMGVDLRIRASGGSALRLVTQDDDRTAGDGVPVATIRGERFELFRALSGRRNPDQIRDYQWEGDPDPFIQYFYPYGVREQALVE